MFRRERVQPLLKYENLNYGSDYILWLDMFFSMPEADLKFGILPERLVNYILHDESMTNKKAESDMLPI